MTKKIITSAPGKAILFGEHTLLYKKKGLVTALDLRTTVELEPSDDLQIYSERYKQDITLTRASYKTILDHIQSHKKRDFKDIDALREEAGTQWLFYPLLYLISEANVTLNGTGYRTGFHATIKSNVPKSLGSSSSAAAALARALFHYYKPTELFSYHEVEHLARRADTLAHGGHASGIDSSASTWGGTIHFDQRCGGGAPLPRQNTPSLLVIESDIYASTYQNIKRVEELYKKNSKNIEKTTQILETIGRKGIDAYLAHNFPDLNAAIDAYYHLLQDLGTTTPTLDKIVTLAKEQGLHAKPTGSWGAGHCIAPLSTDNRDIVTSYCAFFKKNGYNAFPVKTNSEGARRES